MRVIVCGSRTWSDEEPIRDLLAALPPGSTVVHGAARGADQIADSVARRLGLFTEPHPARWDVHGRAAGPIRNQEMADAGADALFAFRAEGASPGTDDMIRRATAARIPAYVVRQGDALDGLSSRAVDALGHQVNLRGVMGAGIAKQIRARWPLAYDAYRTAVDDGRLRLGGMLPVEVQKGGFVVHLAAQRDVGTDRRQTDYLALATALRLFERFCRGRGLRPGLPWRIGCGLGGGDWSEVLPMILRAFPDGVTLFVLAPRRVADESPQRVE